MLNRLFRRSDPREQAELRAYAGRATTLLARALQLRREWLALVAREPEPDALANTAAVHRWELARLASDLGALTPPPRVAGQHRATVTALFDAARAAQLSGAGYRFSNSSKLCDGHALAEEAFDTIARTTADLERRLAQLGQPALAT